MARWSTSFSLTHRVRSFLFVVSIHSIMPRCWNCPACSVVTVFKESHRGTKNKNKVRKIEKNHPCAHPTAPTRKRPINELGSLFSAGHGGEIRGECMTIPSQSAIHLERSSRASRPKNFTEEPVSNADEFDRYCEVVSECEKIAHSSSSSDVKAEAICLGKNKNN